MEVTYSVWMFDKEVQKESLPKKITYGNDLIALIADIQKRFGTIATIKLTINHVETE